MNKTHISAAVMVLVQALMAVEHDRVTHYPGTDSEYFELPSSAVQALVDAGAVKRVDVVDTASLLDDQNAGQAVTFADAADMAANEAKLQELQAQIVTLQQSAAAGDAVVVELSQSLADSQGQVLELQAQVAALQASAAAGDAVVVVDGASAATDVATTDVAAADVVDATAAKATGTKAKAGRA